MLISKNRDYSLFLFGAGNRTTFAELLIRELRSTLKDNFALFSVELPSFIRPPIADFMEIIEGPSFESNEFFSFLDSTLRDQKQSVFIPFMDSACRALSTWGNENSIRKLFYGCPDSNALSDKANIQNFFVAEGFKTPVFTGSTEYTIVKPRFGFGSRDILKIPTHQLTENYFNDSVIVQDFISGPEVSLDIYVSKTNNYSAIARERLRVSDGEVLETRTKNVSGYEHDIIKTLISKYKTLGALNIQLIGDERSVLEVNPRFSGGSTASIAAGWNSISWLIQEHLLSREVVLTSSFNHVHVIRSRRDHIRGIS